MVRVGPGKGLQALQAAVAVHLDVKAAKSRLDLCCKHDGKSSRTLVLDDDICT